MSDYEHNKLYVYDATSQTFDPAVLRSCGATFKNHCQYPKCDCDIIEEECPVTCRCETCRFWS